MNPTSNHPLDPLHPQQHLPQLAAIFKGIKAGRHWCFGDAEYDDLNSELFPGYQTFFAQLELNLHRDSRGFIYATSDDDDYKGSELITRFVVFTAIWVDAIADEGADIGKTLFTPHQSVADLPHLNAEAHRRTLAQVNINNTTDLQVTLRSMERLGLADMDGQGRFTLRAAFHRLLDVCLDTATTSDVRPADTDSATDETPPPAPSSDNQKP